MKYEGVRKEGKRFEKERKESLKVFMGIIVYLRSFIVDVLDYT